MNSVKLSNGIDMPKIGMGTYPLKSEVLTKAVVSAYETGFRLFDTADNYYNEEDLGKSLEVLYGKVGNCRKNLFLVV